MAHRPKSDEEEPDFVDLLILRRRARQADDWEEHERLGRLVDKIRPGFLERVEAGQTLAAQMVNGPSHPWYGQIWNGTHYVEGYEPHPYTGGAGQRCTSCPNNVEDVLAIGHHRPVFST